MTYWIWDIIHMRDTDAMYMVRIENKRNFKMKYLRLNV